MVSCFYVSWDGVKAANQSRAAHDGCVLFLQVAGVSVAQVAKQLGAKTVRVALPVPKGVDLEVECTAFSQPIDCQCSHH